MRWILTILLITICVLQTGCDDENNSPAGPVPGTPSNLSAIALSDSNVRLEWSGNVSSAYLYKIERTVAVDSQWLVIALLNFDSEVYIDAGLVEGTSYLYRISSFIGDNYSDPSNEIMVTTFPASPQSLIITAISDSSVALEWEDNSEVETACLLFRREGLNGNFELIAELPENSTEYHDNDLSSNTDYFYQSRNAMNEIMSNWSNQVSIVTVKPPFDLTGVALSDSSIWLGWKDNSSKETGFLVERQLSGAGEWAELETLVPNKEAFTDLEVTEGRRYKYRVGALYRDAVSRGSDTIELNSLPASPTELSAEQIDSDTVIAIAWVDNSTVETGFELQRKLQFNSEYATIATLEPDVSTFDDTGLSPNVVYLYRVRSLLDTITSGWSNPDSAETVVLTPMQPTDLTSEPLNAYQVRLLWTDNSSNELGFVIERKSSIENNWTILDSLDEDKIRKYDSGLEKLVTYYYRIYAFNEEGNSPYSNVSEVTTPEDVPQIPSILEVSDLTSEWVTLSWQDNSDNEIGFRTARRVLPWSEWLAIGEVDSNIVTFTDSLVEFNAEYEYKVRSFNEVGQSEWARPVGVRIPNGPPGQPEYLHADPNSWNSISLFWSRTTSNEDGFQIERSSSEAGEFQRIAETGQGAISYRDAGLSPATSYWYRVRSFNEIGISEYSNIDSTTTPKHVVYTDDFEEYAAGSPPSSNGWHFDRAGEAFVVVTNIDAHSGMKSILFRDDAADDSSFCALRLEHPELVYGGIEFWLKLTPDSDFEISGYDERERLTYRVHFGSDNSIRVQNNENLEPIEDFNYPVERWIHFELDFNIPMNMYYLMIDGIAVAENLQMRYSDYRSVGTATFSTFENAILTRGFMDEVQIIQHHPE